MGGREVSRPYRVFRRRRAVFILLAMPPTSRGGRRWCCGVADSSLSLKPQTKGTVLLVCICQRHTKRTVPLVSLLEIDYVLLPNRECNQRQKPKKQPWGNVECFAFGGATVRFASLETSFHAANHTIPPPPSYEGLPRCPKDKNRSPLHGEKLLMIK